MDVKYCPMVGNRVFTQDCGGDAELYFSVHGPFQSILVIQDESGNYGEISSI
jgi:hypothetical protein